MNNIVTSIIGSVSCLGLVCGLAVLSTDSAQPVENDEVMGPVYISIPEMTTVCTTAPVTLNTVTQLTTMQTVQTTEITTEATTSETTVAETEPVIELNVEPMIYVLDPEPMPEPSVVPETECPIPEPPFVDSEPIIEPDPPAETEPVDVSQLTFVKHFSRGTYYHTWGCESNGAAGRLLLDCSYYHEDVKGSIASSYLAGIYGYDLNGRTKVYLEITDKKGEKDFSFMNGWYYLDDRDAGNPEVIDFYYISEWNSQFHDDGVVNVDCYI